VGIKKGRLAVPNQREPEKGWWKGLDAYPPKNCFIATAVYGTDTAREIDVLRDFRNEILLPNRLGARFVSFYYKNSPPLADFIAHHNVLRTIVRKGFVTPVVAILSLSKSLRG
jgi:hypothetical protein